MKEIGYRLVSVLVVTSRQCSPSLSSQFFVPVCRLKSMFVVLYRSSSSLVGVRPPGSVYDSVFFIYGIMFTIRFNAICQSFVPTSDG